MLDTMSQRYGQRPSDIFGIEDEVEAFDFDLAVMYKSEEITKEMEAEREKATGKVGKKTKTFKNEHEKLKAQVANVKALQRRAQKAR